jgi:hypothetical protein
MQAAALYRHTRFRGETSTLARHMPLVIARGDRTTELLRISIDERNGTQWLRLEGRVTGVWANEFERAWREIAATRDSSKFGVDLRGVTHMDMRGRQLLAQIHRDTAAEFLADSPITKFFAEEARRVAEGGKQEE